MTTLAIKQINKTGGGGEGKGEYLSQGILPNTSNCASTCLVLLSDYSHTCLLPVPTANPARAGAASRSCPTSISPAPAQC